MWKSCAAGHDRGMTGGGTTLPRCPTSSGSPERGRGPDGHHDGGPVNLASARLRGASLRLATLTNLAVADLSGADLTDARLDGANLTDARFEPCLAQPVPS